MDSLGAIKKQSPDGSETGLESLGAGREKLRILRNREDVKRDLRKPLRN